MYIFLVSLRGQKKLGPRPDRSPLGFNPKFPTSIPTPFICEVPPPRVNDHLCKQPRPLFEWRLSSTLKEFIDINSRTISMIYTQSSHSISSSTTPKDYLVPLVQSSVLRSHDEFSRQNDAIIFFHWTFSFWVAASGIFKCIFTRF